MKNREKYLGSLVILILSIIFLIIGYNISKPNSQENNSEAMFVENEVKKESSFKMQCSDGNIIVDIKGAVKKPGVYTLNKNSRIKDLIEKAGGLSKEADVNRIHMSKKLKDEDYIYVCKIGEEDKKIINSTTNNVENHNNTTSESNNEKVNLNTATLEQLKTIPGIGEVTAKKIIEFREKNGKFSSVEDLMKIDRIGEKTFNKLRDKVDI